MKKVIHNVRIIDGTGSVLERGAILFDGTGIIEISEHPLEGDWGLDKGRKTLLPGLVDCHVHLRKGALRNAATEVEQGMCITVQLEECSKYGIITLRNMGTADDCDVKVRNLINKGLLKGPRLVASGRDISITEGHGWQMDYECDTPEQARKAAGKAICTGADILKMFAAGGVGTKGSIPNTPQLSEEQMRVICEEADRVGLLTGAHCTGIEGVKRAIHAGMHSIEHIQLNEETTRLMKEKGSYYCPTIVTRCNIIHSTEPEYEYMRKKASLQDLERERRAVELCLNYDIPICASTDSIGTLKNNGLTKMGESLHMELMIYHEYGLTNMQAIQSTTRTAARMLRIDDITGTLESGRCADMVLIDGSPDEHLEDIRNVVMTFRGGEVLYQK